jgi:hypothetical protein
MGSSRGFQNLRVSYQKNWGARGAALAAESRSLSVLETPSTIDRVGSARRESFDRGTVSKSAKLCGGALSEHATIAP